MARAEEIVEQIEQLNKELETAKLEGRADALAQVKMLVKLYGFTATDLRDVLRGRKKKKAVATTTTKRTRTKKTAAPAA